MNPTVSSILQIQKCLLTINLFPFATIHKSFICFALECFKTFTLTISTTRPTLLPPSSTTRATQRPTNSPVRQSCKLPESRPPRHPRWFNGYRQEDWASISSYLWTNIRESFRDLDENKQAQVTYQISSAQDWASITITTASKDDPRIRAIQTGSEHLVWGPQGQVHAWEANDPRLALIELNARYARYPALERNGDPTLTGQVANTDFLRELFRGGYLGY